MGGVFIGRRRYDCSVWISMSATVAWRSAKEETIWTAGTDGFSKSWKKSYTPVKREDVLIAEWSSKSTNWKCTTYYQSDVFQSCRCQYETRCFCATSAIKRFTWIRSRISRWWNRKRSRCKLNYTTDTICPEYDETTCKQKRYHLSQERWEMECGYIDRREA